MRSGESYKWSNLAPGTYDQSNCNHSGGAPFQASGPLPLDGGTYQLVIICTGTPAIHFEELGPDNATWLDVPLVPDLTPGTPLTPGVASGVFWKVTIPPGAYRIVVATSTANYVALTRIPTSE